MRRPVSVKPFLSSFFFFIPRVFHKKTSRQDRLAATIASSVDPRHPLFDPFLRRPVDVKAHFRFLLSVNLFPFSQAASVATLPSALLCERFSLGASWVFSIH